MLLRTIPFPSQGPSRYYDPSASEQGQERRKHEVCIVCNEEGHEKRNCPHEQVSLPSLDLATLSKFES